MYAREKGNAAPYDAVNLRAYLEVWVIFPTFALAKETNGLAATQVV